MFSSHKTGAFVYLTNIYMFLSVLQSMAHSLLKPCTTPVMHGRSFIYALQGAYLHYLLGCTVFGGKAGNTVPKSKLFSSFSCQDHVSSTLFPDVLSLPHSSRCQNGSGKEVENRANAVTLKAAEWSVCPTEDAGCDRVLNPFLGGECWKWFPAWRLTAPSGLIDGRGWCECWWPQPCPTSSHFRGFGLLPWCQHAVHRVM